MYMFELTGKNILVTGSSKGIGQAIAISLAQKGANIAIHYNKTSPTATLKAVQS
ncbi:MAG: SDR family NAD(P)-dependent oxidoreductase, partial [Gammaproteobacteria bacterium]